MNVGVTDGAGKDVKVVDDVIVLVPDIEYTAVIELVEDIEEDLVLIAVTEDVGDAVSVFEN